MPPVIVAVVAYAAGYITLTSLIVTIVSYAIQSMLAPKKPTAPQAPSFTSYSRDRTLTIRQPAQSRRVIYGQVKIGGTICFMHATSSDTNLHIVVALAGHPIEEIGDFYLNDELVPLDVDGNATGKYAGYVRVKKHLGSTTQTADSDLTTEAADKWTADHRLQGVAYAYVRLIGNGDLFPNGLPNMSFVCKGKNDIYDPRDLSTGWTDNAALCIADYMESTKYGIGATYGGSIDNTVLIASANVCDESVALADGGTEARYTMNGSFESSQKPEETIGAMLSTMSGKVIFTGGTWAILAGYHTASVLTLDENHARGPIKVIPRISRRDLFNAVKGVYSSPENYWQPADFPAVTNATYEAEDNDQRIFRDIDLPYTTSPATAQRIAKIELEKGRQQIVVEFPANLIGLQLRAGDTVALTLTRFGWTEKLFEVATWRFENYDDAQGEPAIGISLILRETASGVYDWSSGEETTVDLAPDTNLPDPFTVGAPSGLVAASGTDHLLATGDGGITSRIFVSWDVLPGVFVTEYEVEAKKSTDADYASVAIVRTGSSAYISPVEDALNYDIRVRAVNSIGVRGAWSYVLAHTVVGKTEAPAQPDTFTISRLADGTRRYAWSLAVVPADVRSGGGYKIRYYSGTTSDWSAMTDLHTGMLLASPFESNELAAGTYTWAIKTIDSSGNESAAATFISGEIGDPRLNNVLLQRIEESLAWPGTLTDCFLHAPSNSLLPNSSNTIADLAAAITSLASTINAVGTNANPIVYETPIIDLGANVTFTPLVTITGTGTATLTMKTGTTADGTVVGAYGALTTVSGKRYVKIKVSMADTAALISGMTTLIDADTAIDEFEDVNTATETATWFASTAAGHFKIGSKSGNLASISSAKIVALQNVGAGWTWELLNKSSTVNSQPAAEFKIYNNTATLADAVIDVELKGPKV